MQIQNTKTAIDFTGQKMLLLYGIEIILSRCSQK
jgi:hypothetical protein